jgi:hypothetical protein
MNQINENMQLWVEKSNYGVKEYSSFRIWEKIEIQEVKIDKISNVGI